MSVYEHISKALLAQAQSSHRSSKQRKGRTLNIMKEELSREGFYHIGEATQERKLPFEL